MGLEADLGRVFPAQRLLARAIDRAAWAGDASCYRMVPRLVVFPESVEDVRALFRASRAHHVPLTFRAAGTSLSGQAVTDGILAVVSRHWRRIEIEDGGRRVRVGPGAIGGIVNARLRPYGVKIGPDPASIDACMMGGILANNSSGMCCGVALNAYHTLRSMRYVLPGGTEVDSTAADADDRLHRDEPALAEGLADLRRRIAGNPDLRERIRAKYRLKNTVGYSLNAFVDYERPVEILTHLMIGSEGTLGFIAEAVLDTVPDHPHKYTGLLFFEDVESACAAIAPLRESGAQALELMDRAALRSVEGEPGVPREVAALPASAAAILAEYGCDTAEEVAARRETCARLLPRLTLCAGPHFTDEPERQAALWRVRKGIIASVGAMRPRGTSLIIEDVVFPVERLASGVADLRKLLEEHGYGDAVIFGHARDGNLHFCLSQAFEDPREVARYDGFMRALAGLVARRYDGALKGEHGTGRNVAPFLADEWGEEACALMRELKRLVDPEGLLNPGVILNDDPRAHVTHLKELPVVESEVDPCIECGFCEHVCPSRDLTLTPRQRIVVRREMARLGARGAASPALRDLREIEAAYGYAALETCAADGMCATACPVGIDTGKLVKRLRRQGRAEATHELAALLARRFAAVEIAVRTALRAGGLAASWLGDDAVARASRAVRALSGGILPPWSADLPRAAPGRLPATARTEARAVYFPTCVTRTLGAPRAAPHDEEKREAWLPELLPGIARRAATPVWIPDDAPGHCCGMAFGSKGFQRAATLALERTVHAMWSWTERGRLPVVVDSSPCAWTLRCGAADLPPAARARLEALRILDGIEFAAELLPRLPLRRLPGEVQLHPVCSIVKLGLTPTFRDVAAQCAETVRIPVHAGCCGFAGDRGFAFPELTAAATRQEARELAAAPPPLGRYSTSRTCEIALGRATGRRWRSVWSLLERASRG